MAVERESILNEIEDAYNIHGMSMANLAVASNGAQQKITEIFREMSGQEYAIVRLRGPIDRLAMYYTVSAIIGGSAWTPEDYARANVFEETINIYSADPEEMAAKIYHCLVKIAHAMAEQEVP